MYYKYTYEEYVHVPRMVPRVIYPRQKGQKHILHPYKNPSRDGYQHHELLIWIVQAGNPGNELNSLENKKFNIEWFIIDRKDNS